MVLLLATLTISVDVLTQPSFIGTDFPSFFYACRGARRRVDIYDVQALGQISSRDGISQPFPFIYPPVFAYLFKPMARLKVTAAQRLWSLATVLAFCSVSLTATVGMRRRALQRAADPLRWTAAAVFSICLALALNFHNVVAMGQINVFVLALMLPALVLPDEAGHLSAIGLALAILLKTTPALFLTIFLLQRRWRLVGRTCAWMGTLVALSLILGAGRAWIAYFRLLPVLSPGGTIPGLFPPAIVCNFSLAGLFARLTDDPARATRLTLLSTALLGLPLVWTAWSSRAREGDRGVVLSASALMIAAAPLAYVHHAIFLFPGLFWWLAAERTQPRASIAAVLLLGMAAATDFPSLYARLELSPRLWSWTSSLNLYALIVLYGLGLYQALGAGRRAGHTPALNALAGENG